MKIHGKPLAKEWENELKLNTQYIILIIREENSFIKYTKWLLYLQKKSLTNLWTSSNPNILIQKWQSKVQKTLIIERFNSNHVTKDYTYHINSNNTYGVKEWRHPNSPIIPNLQKRLQKRYRPKESQKDLEIIGTEEGWQGSDLVCS